METEGGGLAVTPLPERGKKWPPSPPTLGNDEDLSKPSDDDDGGSKHSDVDGDGSKPSDDDGDGSNPSDDDDAGDWLVSGSEEDEDHDDEGTHPPYTVDDIPRPGCDHDKQSDVMFRNPNANLRGPLPIRLFPAFKDGKHYFGLEYNLADKSQISVDRVEDCPNECCCFPMSLLQFIDIKIAGYRHTNPGAAKVYGFVAARERFHPLRNYVYQREIENCESVPVKRKTGVARLSLTGPARVISMTTRALIEFEIHARNEDEITGDDDLIIEGCTQLENMFKSKSFIEHRRLYGERCALDIKYMVLINAVEARVEITVLRLGSDSPGSVDMKLYAKTSGFSEVIQLFRGATPEPGVMMSFAVAVERHSGFDLYIEGSPKDDPILGQKLRPYQWWECGFASGYHGTSEEVAELGELAAFSVKVTWRSYMKNTKEWYARC
ncbi:unnamed protein product [Urochloa decumbens]|uniref:DUF6598 domain-containing protein n=1 Tax=Urochloa decumbens TaxID=240449 RepID=A0ABC8VIX1_9POAL